MKREKLRTKEEKMKWRNQNEKNNLDFAFFASSKMEFLAINGRGRILYATSERNQNL